MDTRKRGFLSVPSKGPEFITKKEVAQRRSLPLCPPHPIKKKITKKFLFPPPTGPRAIFFTKPVTLSRIYNEDKEQAYFDQVFAKNISLGEGSFGIVYKVRSRIDDKYYAVKQFKSSHNMQYGVAEVKNLEKVGDHDNCVKFYMAWEECKIVHILMEYCQLSLAQYAILAENVPEDQLWEILYDILNALEYLHGKQLVHLDVKPGNILMSNGFYKLTDFGLLVDLNGKPGGKISTISDGDAKYLACEVLDSVYTYSCDIFGLGISLLELATNIELPEFGPLWHQIRKDNLPPAFYNAVTPQFAVTIEKMMSISHWDRPAAGKILKYSALKKVHRRDNKLPRKNYCECLTPEAMHNVIYNDNNNIIETPRRPLYDIQSSLSHGTDNLRDLRMDTSKISIDSVKELDESTCVQLSTDRRGLSRVKLVF